VRRATEAERERLNDTFATLCRIDSPSGHERACASWVSAELRRIGLDVDEDGAGPAAGSDAGNLLSRIDGTEDRSIALCAHLDTVPLAAPVDPVLVNGGWENANDGILGADNKAAVAVMLELARRLKGTPQPPAVGIELVFTVCEEVSLRGSREFDTSRLRSSFGYVFRPRDADRRDRARLAHALPDLCRAARARRATRGFRPEDGRSAIAAAASAIASMRLGRLDPETTANVGTIAGGSAINVVPDRCTLEAEARSPRRGSRGGPSRPRWSITSRTPPMPMNATST